MAATTAVHRQKQRIEIRDNCVKYIKIEHDFNMCSYIILGCLVNLEKKIAIKFLS